MAPKPDEKNEAPPSTLSVMAKGLDMTTGKGPIERYGPAVFGILYVVMLALPVFLSIPNEAAYSVLLGVIGPVGFGWISKLGVT